MSAAFRRMKLFGYAVVLLAFALTVAISAPSLAAQEDDMEDPTISISPSGGTFTNPSRFVSIQWCDNMGLNGSSRVIKHNGNTVTSSFDYTYDGVGCNNPGDVRYSSDATITLTEGTNSVYAYICDLAFLCVSKTVYLTYDTGKDAPVVTTDLQSQDLRDPALCGVGCADFTISYSTPAYRSLDQDRSTTLLYRSDQARPVPMVLLKVYDPSTDPADTISVRLKRKWTGTWQTLHTGTTEVYYDNPQTTNHTSHIAVALDGGSLATGSYDYTAYVYSRWSDGTSKETQVDVRVLVLNEEDSPFGWGWSVAGLQRVHTQVLGGSSGIVVTDGSGGIAFLSESCSTQGGNTHCLYTEPAGFAGEMEYDNWFTGYRYRRWFPDGSELRFDATGRMTSARDRYGNVTTYAYDGSGRLTSITDPAGKATTFGYGTDTKLAWIKDPANRQSTVTINGSYDVTDIVDPASGEPLGEMVYSGHRLTRYFDRANAQWDIAYDFAGRVATVTAPSVKLYTGSSSRPVTATKSLGAWLMDASSSLASPGANRTAWHRRVRVTDPEGHQTVYRELSSFGQPERIEMERGRVARMLFNSSGQLTREAPPSGDSVSYTWSNDRLTSRTLHSSGQVTNYTYTSYDNLSTVSGLGQPTIQYFYKSNGAPSAMTVNGDTLYTYLSDSKGRITKATDADGFERLVSYFSSGFQNTSQLTVGGSTTQQRYDAYGRLQHVINALNDTVTYSYDAINRVTSVNDEANNTTAFGYSSMFRTSVTDPLGNVYGNYPNALGWDTTVVDPGNRKEKYGYDRDGAVRSYTNRRSSTLTYVYNDAHEMTSMTADGQTTNYTVSVDMLTRTASNAASTDTVVILPNTRETWQRTSRGGASWEVEWEHDTQWRPDFMRIRKNGSTTHWVDYGYDPSGRMSQLGAKSTGTTTIGYDPRFNAETFRWSATGDTLVLRHPSSGSPGRYRYSDATLEAFAGRRYAQDSLQRVSERWNGDLTKWDEFDHNALGMLTGVRKYEDTSSGGVTCDWDDDRGELCEESTDTTFLGNEIYSWDAVGNPAAPGDSVVDGRLTVLGSDTLTYDADGNLTQLKTGGGETVAYWWNSLSQLDSANSSVHGKVRYKYDGFGRRVYMSDATGTTHFLWDDDDVVADIDTSGNATRFYNYYPGMSKIHSMVVGTDTYLYLKDLTGNVLGLQSESGAITNTYEYSPFGELKSVSEGVANRFRFASGEQDRLGLYYFRARHYDPALRRFISEDPIRLAGGINPYMYAANNPIDLTDRSGLCPKDESETEDVPCVIPGITVTVPGDSDNGGGDDSFEPGERDVPGAPGSGPLSGSGGRGEAGRGASEAGLGLTGCQAMIGLFAVNVGASVFTFGWALHAVRARRAAQLGGSPPWLYSRFFHENLREVFAVNVASPGGVWNTATGATIFHDPSQIDLWDVAKFLGGFVPFVGMAVSGIDMMHACGWM